VGTTRQGRATADDASGRRTDPPTVDRVTDWTFDGFGSQFDEHALKHLPHYETVHEMLVAQCRYALPPGGTIADLGCSTGRALKHLAASFPGRPFHGVGYDADQTMLDRAAEGLDLIPHISSELHPVDLCDPAQLVHENAHVTLLLWTLQFLPAEAWTPLLKAARERANRDGVLLVAAKTRFESSRWQEVADGALVEWKANHGVTPAEIIDKARSLRGTMLVVDAARLLDEISDAGWREPAVLFRWHAWVLIAAHR